MACPGRWWNAYSKGSVSWALRQAASSSETERLTPDGGRRMYGLMKPSTVCENVFVTPDGDYDFYNFQKTSNGHAVVCRRDFMHASRSINIKVSTTSS